MKPKILVCDDDSETAGDFVESIKRVKTITKKFKIEVLFLDQTSFRTEVTKLAERQMAFRKGDEWEEDGLRFDEASILVLDFNLITTLQVITGELVAYLARCFSKCGIIIGINLDGTNPFDLKLRGHPESFCDVNIGDEQLANPGLWTNEFKGFRPWSWPNLIELCHVFESRVEETLQSLESSVSDFLGFGKSMDFLPKSVAGFIGKEPSDTTLRKFAFESGNCFQRKDRIEGAGQPERDNLIIARVVAARISKWLECLVLPGQDILVDAPHLVSRFPSLLKGRIEKKDSWNATTSLNSPKKLGLDFERIKQFIFAKNKWLSRPAWFWSELSNSPIIKEVRTPWDLEPAAFVFCEDTSRFHLRKKCMEFTADLDSPYILRFVRMPIPEVDYQPRTRLVSG